MTLHELVTLVANKKPALFLGSGACVSSGGPSAIELAEYLCEQLSDRDALSVDLTEVASLLELGHGREAVVQAVTRRLTSIEPCPSMVRLAQFDWANIYTTNFDCCVEKAHQKAGKPLSVVRSNYDYGKSEDRQTAVLFKLHGCITQDVSIGHKSRMLLTQQDYAESAKYREAVFSHLACDLAGRDAVIIGHSLRDPHIRHQVEQAALLKRERGAPGSIFLLLFTQDELRARLMEQQGVRVVFGCLDDFVHEMCEVSEQGRAEPVRPLSGDFLTPRQSVGVVDVQHAIGLSANAKRLFHGAEATYADIAKDFTFRRQPEDELVRCIMTGEKTFAVITGTSGVGKTTLARRVLYRIQAQGVCCWEWRKDYPFRAAEWIKTEATLRDANKRGVLLVDECLYCLPHLNGLCGRIARQEKAAIQVMLTANHSQWLPRVKDPALFAAGHHIHLSTLQESELEGLLDLLDRQPDIRALADQPFVMQSRRERMDRLRRRCSSDMYVCLKHVFASQGLDTILLTEYGQLSLDLQDIYRRVSALDAAGGFVHRQLVLRTIAIHPTSLSAYLAQLEGLVNEYDIDPSIGLYGWRTRHRVIAEVISKYKLGTQQEIYEFFKQVIQAINPTVGLELKFLRELCSGEFGLQRVLNPLRRVELLRDIVSVVPGERVPRHRLVSMLIETDAFDEAEQELRIAENTVGLDAPLRRYQVKLYVAKAMANRQLARPDREALLREAERLALQNLARAQNDKYAYKTYAEVGEALQVLTGDASVLNHAVIEMKEAMTRLKDPDFEGLFRRFDRRMSH